MLVWKERVSIHSKEHLQGVRVPEEGLSQGPPVCWPGQLERKTAQRSCGGEFGGGGGMGSGRRETVRFQESVGHLLEMCTRSLAMLNHAQGVGHGLK